MRVKIIKNHEKYRKGDVVEVSNNVAFGLIDCGAGIISKDITDSETKKKGVIRGRSIKLRVDNVS